MHGSTTARIFDVTEATAAVGSGSILRAHDVGSAWQPAAEDLAPSGRVTPCPVPEVVQPSGTLGATAPQRWTIFGFVLVTTGVIAALGGSGSQLTPAALQAATRSVSATPSSPRRRTQEPATRPRETAAAPSQNQPPGRTQNVERSAEGVQHSVASDDAETIPITAQEQARAAQRDLSLSVTQLAEVLRVSRPTIYSYLAGDVDVPRDKETADRLRGLYRYGRLFRAKTNETLGRFGTAPLSEDAPSLLQLLQEERWDTPAIEGTLEILADRLQGRSLSRNEDLARGVGVARPADPETIELDRIRLRLGSLG